MFKSTVVLLPNLPMQLDNKEIFPADLFPLESGKILVQYQYQKKTSPSLSDAFLTTNTIKKLTTRYLFKIYDPASQTYSLVNKKEYTHLDLATCYLPDGPVLKELGDKIFLNKTMKLRNIILARQDEFYKATGLLPASLNRIRFYKVSLSQYIFFNNSNQLTQLTVERDQLKVNPIIIKNQRSFNICHSKDLFFALSPNRVCFWNLKDLYFLRKETENWIIEDHLLTIDLNKIFLKDRKHVTLFTATISDHEILWHGSIVAEYQNKEKNRIEKRAEENIFIKFDLHSKTIHKLISTQYFNTHNVHIFSLSPLLFLLTGTDAFYIFNPHQMELLPFSLPKENMRLYGIMPDGNLLMAKLGNEKNAIGLYTTPITDKLKKEWKNAIKKELEDKASMPSVLSHLIVEYVSDPDLPVSINESSKLFSLFKFDAKNVLPSSESLQPIEQIKVNI